MKVKNLRGLLDAKATDLAAIHEQFRKMLDYAHQYLRVDKDGYCIVFGPYSTRFRNACSCYCRAPFQLILYI